MVGTCSEASASVNAASNCAGGAGRIADVPGDQARKALAVIPASDPSWRRTEASQPGL